MKYNILDLFSGIGGFSLAMQRAGIEIDKHYTSEVDKYAEQIYKRQFLRSIRLGDVTKIGNEHGKIDIITGGFPCQSFSIAGKRRGFSDTRGTLFFEIERLARFYKPSYMVLENVKGLFSHDGGNTIRVILDKLRGLDYSVQLLLLNTVDFGIPQNRERVFFICTLAGKCQPEISGIRERKAETINSDLEIYKKNGEKKNSSIAATLTEGGHSGGNHSDMDLLVQPVLSPDRLEKRQNDRRFKDDGEPSFTLTGQDRHGVLISDSGKGRKREVRTIAPPLRAHDGCGHDNYTFSNITLTQQGYKDNIHSEDGYYGKKKETNTIKALLLLRKEIGEETFKEWGFRIIVSFQQKEILQSDMYGESVRCKASKDGYSSIECETSFKKNDTKGSLRIVWSGECKRCSSQRQKCPQQCQIKLNESLQELSQQNTPQAWFMQNLWKASEGIKSLQQALYKIQEVRRSIIHEIQEEGGRGVVIRRLTPL